MKAGWQRKTIDAVCEVVNGGTPKTGVAEYWDGPHQWITPAEMGKRASPFVSQTERTLTEAGLQNSSARLLPAQSVILSSRAPIGHLVINTAPMATNQGCKGLVPRNGLDSKFLYYYLASIVPQLNDLGTGATFKELSGGKLKEVPIPVPTLPEQHRIVAILDEAFDGIATTKANAEKNLQNARALFESHLQSIFKQHGEGWPLKTLGELSVKITDGTHNSPPYVDSGIPMLDSKHVIDGFVIDDSEPEKFITRETDDLLAKRCKPCEGDILISSRGSIGKIAIVRDGQDFNIMGNMILIRLPDGVSREFAAFYLYSKVGHIESIARGVAQKGLYLNQIRDYLMPVPPSAKQAEIGRQLDLMAGETHRLESLYQQKLTALDDLKKSLLHQAFSGQLTERSVEEAAA